MRTQREFEIRPRCPHVRRYEIQLRLGDYAELAETLRDSRSELREDLILCPVSARESPHRPDHEMQVELVNSPQCLRSERRKELRRCNAR
eukprot:CAMPEP_0198650302 /NCGR_PEP_ID=MMETSP1467-20131203/4877_1 /TAXON_ID=1462469 /ORGANISM="unid. sp., Strain CCMP2135" /LENGTH=89 /DNA_ID=CAMNT_0044386143 /DNA_START=18 /DNA_END=283 /DNA_ORIENTATION=-